MAGAGNTAAFTYLLECNNSDERLAAQNCKAIFHFQSFVTLLKHIQPFPYLYENYCSELHGCLSLDNSCRPQIEDVIHIMDVEVC
jgi:hypothetical protein